MAHPPVALTIAGSDCSAGAGMQADLKTFNHFGVHGLTAVTCVVSETPHLVQAVHAVPVEIVESQISLLLDSYPVTAVKTGMLHSRALIETVERCLRGHPDIALVVDPVMIASSGSSLIEQDAINAYLELLFPLARLITPNIPEAQALSGRPIASLDEMQAAATELSNRHRCAVLLKGGHLDGDSCVDVLAGDGAIRTFEHARIPVGDTHGTGCTLSAAICAALAHGSSLADAIGQAKDYLGKALRSSYTFTRNTPLQALNQGTCRESLDGMERLG